MFRQHQQSVHQNRSDPARRQLVSDTATHWKPLEIPDDSNNSDRSAEMECDTITPLRWPRLWTLLVFWQWGQQPPPSNVNVQPFSVLTDDITHCVWRSPDLSLSIFPQPDQLIVLIIKLLLYERTAGFNRLARFTACTFSRREKNSDVYAELHLLLLQTLGFCFKSAVKISSQHLQRHLLFLRALPPPSSSSSSSSSPLTTEEKKKKNNLHVHIKCQELHNCSAVQTNWFCECDCS